MRRRKEYKVSALAGGDTVCHFFFFFYPLPPSHLPFHLPLLAEFRISTSLIPPREPRSLCPSWVIPSSGPLLRRLRMSRTGSPVGVKPADQVACRGCGWRNKGPALQLAAS